MEVSSAELRGEVLAACDPNEGARVIAVRFQVSESRVRRIGQVRREAGQMAPQTASVRQPKWHARSDWLAAKLTVRPDVYLRAPQAALRRNAVKEFA